MNPTDPANTSPTPAPSAVPTQGQVPPAPSVAQPVTPQAVPTIEAPAEVVTPEEPVATPTVEAATPVTDVAAPVEDTSISEPIATETEVADPVSTPDVQPQGEQPPVPQPVEAPAAVSPTELPGATSTETFAQADTVAPQPVVAAPVAKKSNKLLIVLIATVVGVALAGAGVVAALTLF